MKKGKIILTILMIILISLISFGGLYVKNTKFVENIIPEYQLGMDLQGGRHVVLSVDKTINEVYYDEKGNKVEEKTDKTKTEKIPVNAEEVLTKENYEKSKQVIEQRLEQMNVEDYTIRLNKETGEVFVTLTENSNTDLNVQYITIKGEFKVVNEAEEVLLNNGHIKNVQVGYTPTESGTTVYLTIYLNEDGTAKLKDISNTYIKTTGEDGKEVTKKIELKIDDSTILSTYFEEEISNGIIQMSIGQATTSTSELQSYLTEASNLSVLLKTGAMPVAYSLAQNKYVLADANPQMFIIPAIVFAVIIAIALVIAIIKYGKNGLLAAISFVGYVATLLIVIRYTNVILTMEGIAGIVMSIILHYIITVYALHIMKKEQITFGKAILKSLVIDIPALIVAVSLSFAGWIPTFSFGMTMFWGIAISVICQYIITKTLIENATKMK